jgi:hypothetical protein
MTAHRSKDAGSKRSTTDHPVSLRARHCPASRLFLTEGLKERRMRTKSGFLEISSTYQILWCKCHRDHLRHLRLSRTAVLRATLTMNWHDRRYQYQLARSPFSTDTSIRRLIVDRSFLESSTIQVAAKPRDIRSGWHANGDSYSHPF